MANTGVLPFVRGVDFTKNDFSVSIFIIIFLLFSEIITIYNIKYRFKEFV